MGKRIVFSLFFLFFLFPLFTAQVFAYKYSPEYHGIYSEDGLGITYSLDTQGGGKKYVDSLEEFLTSLPSTGYWANRPSDYKAENGEISFSSGHFEYHIPIYVFEDEIAQAVFYGNLQITDYFEAANWLYLDDDRNLIPDDIDEIVEVFDEVYKDYFGDSSVYKFKQAWSGDLPIQIDYECFASYDESSGLCALGGYSSDEYIVLDLIKVLNNEKGIVYKDVFELKATIAHEIFHAIQYYYIGDNMWDISKNDNFVEGMAVLMQRQIAGWGDDGYLEYLENSPLLSPQKSIFGLTDQDDMSNYGSFVWYNFLHRKYGKTIIKDLLEQYAKAASTETVYRSFIATEEALKLHDTSLVNAYLEYVVWNYDYTKYADGKYFKPTYITKSHSKFPTGDISIPGEDAPALFASNYVEFNLGASTQNLEVSFTGNLDADMYVTFLSSKKGTVDYKTAVNYPIGKGESYSFVVPSSGNDTVVMIVSVLDINQLPETNNIFYDYVYPYSYSAKKVSPTETVSDVSIGDVNLKDYFVFDPGNDWEYESTYTEGENTENDVINVETIECDLRDDCITYDYGQTKQSFYFFGKNIYGIGNNNDEIPQTKYLTIDPFSFVLDDEIYDFYGYKNGESGVSQVSIACTPTLVDDYEFNGISDVAVLNDCVLQSIDSMGGKEQRKSKEYYVKGVGLVKYVEDDYYDDNLRYSYEQNLIDTNLINLYLEEEVVTNEIENPFPDLDDNNKNLSAILYLKSQNIINGYPDGTFKPDNPVNRAELLKILVEGKGVSPTVADYSNCFSDVEDEWYAPYVCYAKAEGWVDGYADGTFKPARTVNKVEAIKMLLNSQGIEVPTTVTDKSFDDVNLTDWFAPYISKAKELGILEETGTLFSGGEGMKRAGICENLYRLLIK